MTRMCHCGERRRCGGPAGGSGTDGCPWRVRRQEPVEISPNKYIYSEAFLTRSCKHVCINNIPHQQKNIDSLNSLLKLVDLTLKYNFCWRKPPCLFARNVSLGSKVPSTPATYCDLKLYCIDLRNGNDHKLRMG